MRSTEGWPAAVRLACEAMRALAPGAARRGGRAPAPARRRAVRLPGARGARAGAAGRARAGARRRAAGARRIPELCAALGVEGAPEALGSLARRGLFAESRSARRLVRADGPDARRRAGLAAARRRGSARRCTPAPPAGTRRTASPRWPALAGGRSATTPPPRGCWPSTARRCCARGRSRRSSRRRRDARRAARRGARAPAGRGPPAARRLGRGAGVPGPRGGRRGHDRAGLAWRIGLIHHLRGHLDEALAAYRRGRDDAEPSGDAALLHAWHASAHWLRGDADAVPRARHARPRGGAWPAARTARWRRPTRCWPCSRRSRATAPSNDAHYLRALDHAERAGDVLQVIRIRVNRGSRNLEEGAYEAAIVELDLAIRLADLGGFGAFRALALTNRGESRLRLGPPGGGDRRPRRRAPDLPAPGLRRRRLPAEASSATSTASAATRRWRAPPTRRRRGAATPWATCRRSCPRSRASRACSPATTPSRRARSRSAPRATGPAWARPPPCSPSATSRWPPATATGAARAAAQAGRGRARAARPRPHGRGARARGPVGARASARATRRSSRPSRSGTSSATRSARRAPSSPSAWRCPGERGAAAAREAEARLRELGARPQMAAGRPRAAPPPRWPSRRSGAFACCATGRRCRARRGARARRATC